jgi:hypothetical protein
VCVPGIVVVVLLASGGGHDCELCTQLRQRLVPLTVVVVSCCGLAAHCAELCRTSNWEGEGSLLAKAKGPAAAAVVAAAALVIIRARKVGVALSSLDFMLALLLLRAGN